MIFSCPDCGNELIEVKLKVDSSNNNIDIDGFYCNLCHALYNDKYLKEVI